MSPKIVLQCAAAALAIANSAFALPPAPRFSGAAQPLAKLPPDAPVRTGNDPVRFSGVAGSNLPDTKQGVAIWGESADELRTSMKALAKEFAKRPGTHKGNATATRVAILVDDLQLSVQKDIEASGKNKVVFLSSHTLEGIGKLGLDLIEWAAEKDGPLSKSSLGPLIDRMGGLSALASGAGQALGSGKFEAETVKQLTTGGAALGRQQILDIFEKQKRTELKLDKIEHELTHRREFQKLLQDRLTFKSTQSERMSVQGQIRNLDKEIPKRQAIVAAKQAELLKARNQLETRLLYLDIVPELAGAVSANLKAGKLTMDVVDRYSDAMIMASATYLVTVIPAPMQFKGAIRDTIVAGARFTRHASEDAFRVLYAGRFEMLDEYAQYQAHQIAKKSAVLRIDEVFSPKQLRDVGFRAKQITDVNAQTQALNTHLNSYLSGRPDTQVKQPNEPFRFDAVERHRPPAPVTPTAPPDRGDQPPSGGVKGVTVNSNPAFEPMKPDKPSNGTVRPVRVFPYVFRIEQR